ncbi:MAG: hypothetical protein JSC188_000873 [Candidatus Tokpelaia sp. JSC188]|nr:MAG: hypothetical protein JSC188_000873 [Candidatus Tokpelaia sp. JSC188]
MSLRVTLGIIAVNLLTSKVMWKIGSDILAQQHAPVEMLDGSSILDSTKENIL